MKHIKLLAAAVQFHPEALVLGRPSDTRYDLVALEAILKDIGRLCGSACGADSASCDFQKPNTEQRR